MNFKVVVDDLVKTHGCHAIILYGSYSRGDFFEKSDLDIVGIKDNGDYTFDNRIVDGFLLDAHISSQKRIDDNPVALIRIHNGKLLYDAKGAGKTLLQKLNDAFRKGPTPLTIEERRYYKASIEKSLIRIEQNDVVGHFRKIAFLNDLLELYFILGNQWYFGPKESFVWLEQHDRSCMQRFQLALHPNARSCDIQTLAEFILHKNEMQLK